MTLLDRIEARATERRVLAAIEDALLVNEQCPVCGESPCRLMQSSRLLDLIPSVDELINALLAARDDEAYEAARAAEFWSLDCCRD